MTILWLLDIDWRYEFRHGATLRYTELSRRLMAAGHRVYYVLNTYASTDRESRTQFLLKLRQMGCFTEFFELEGPPYPQPRAKLSRLLVHPRIRDAILHQARAAYCDRFGRLVKDLQADACVVSDRSCLFLLSLISGQVRTVIDWCDSHTVFQAREIQRLGRSAEIGALPAAIKEFASSAADEAYYSALAAANLLVSEGDKHSLDRLNRRPALNVVVPNGVTASASVVSSEEKDLNTLIFTGSMDFPPNYTGAIWLIDKVMPRLQRTNAAIRLVIAGQNPVPELKRRASSNIEITGMVPDLSARIARSRLYVAPIFSGTGFRNKIVEALVHGTYVIGTPMAFEFLNDVLRDNLVAASTAEEFVERILTYLKTPQAFDERLPRCIEILRRDYSWQASAQRFEALCIGNMNFLA